VNHVQIIKRSPTSSPQPQWRFEYSPETFSATELEFALEVCNAVIAAWNSRPPRTR
jgi:2-isopropylmalate synthase